MVCENFRSFFGKVIDWIYPPACACCEKPGKLICDDCFSNLPAVGKHFCSRCGKPLKPRHFCRLCGVSDFHFTAARAPYLYEGPVSAMIRKLKYHNAMDLAPILAQLLADYWKKIQWEADVVIPIPLSEKRRMQRGYNQSELIAKDFGITVGIPCDTRALMKQQDTPHQVGLSAEERQANLKGAFAAEPKLVRGKRILLLDDVMTTGSTFSECSDVLLKTGAKSVYCLSVATTPIDHGKQKMLDAQQREQTNK